MLAAVAGNFRRRLAETFGVFGDVARSPNLRRLELAWSGSILGHWAWGVALAVYAYQEGGARAVGVLGLVKMIPSVLASPFAAVLGDRYPRERVLLVTDVVRASTVLAAAALVEAGAPTAAVFALAGFYSAVATAFRPAQAALLPSLARTPGELTAANVASSSIENIGTFVGPAIAGFLLAVSGVSFSFALTAAAFVWSALMVTRIRGEPRAAGAKVARTRFRDQAGAGFEALGADGDVRVLVGLYGAQTFVNGAMNVLLVVVAIELLDTGESGLGLLYSAVGVGGVIGALVAAALIGRRRLAGDFRAGMVLYGAPLALLAAVPDPAAALVLMAVLGIGSTIIDVSALTLMQRSVADDVLARVFGILGSVMLGMLGLGAIVAPFVLEAIGLKASLVATGVLLPALGVLTWRRLGAIDRKAQVAERELHLLRGLALFAPLAPPTLEHLAASLTRLEAAPGDVIVRQGDRGDRFYVLASGSVDVAVDGRPGTTLGPGECFGEIALLRDVPRTATVTAREDSELYALDREEFVAAVSGNPASAEAAEAVVGSRLGSLRPGTASI
jgi:MFS family permease